MANTFKSPPPGGDQDRGPALLANFWTEFGIALLIIVLRLQSRLILKNLGRDDWVMFFSLVSESAS